MPLSFFWSANISDVLDLRRPLLSFFRFQGLTHAVKDAIRLLVVASLVITPALVAVVVVVVVVDDVVVVVVVVFVVVVVAAAAAAVNVILLSDIEILSRSNSKCSSRSVCYVSSLALRFWAPFRRSVAFLMMAS